MAKKNPLSPRETQALQGTADGKTRDEIAAEWGVSVGTVHNHIRLVHAKLDTETTNHALAIALRNGWIE